MNLLILERGEGHYSALGLDLHDAWLAFEDTDDEMEEAFLGLCFCVNGEF